ncbi:MAG: hypothetical protein KIT14_23015 [bacterium]|nr:hypothetical protein [bacterium]
MRTLLPLVLVLVVACGPREPPAPIPVPETADQASAAPAADAPPAALRVDHAWVKGADDPGHQRAIATLRTRVVAGEGMSAAWIALGQDGNVWHVGESELYEYAVIPLAARDLPVGSVSPVIPGDGGLHLFRILAHESAE